jgi:tetratricopeptide (TPR) repeat protein
MTVLVSFYERNVRLPSGKWLFKKRHEMRFEWFALLAYKRIAFPGDQAWVSLEEIAMLPNWKGRSKHHIATNVGRYLQSGSFERSQVFVSGDTWSGPYRLETRPLSIRLDISQTAVRQRLHLRYKSDTAKKKQRMLEFTLSYVRAQWLFFRGRLRSRAGQKTTLADSAFERLRVMAEDKKYSPTFRLVACLAAVEVLFRLGRVKAARETLHQNHHLLRRVPDQSLQAQFCLKMAWARQRASSGTDSNRAVESALAKAGAYAENSGDRASLGLLAHRTAGYLTKRGRHSEAVDHLIAALEAHLITGNYHQVQFACADIGSIVHRLGLKHYDEARKWLLASILVGRWMRIGRDDAHGEMILGKMCIEQGKRFRSEWLLGRAERIAEKAGNQINLADVKMVWGFWYKRFGQREDQIKTLMDAVRIYRKLYEFDSAQKENYMSRKFPDVWDEVLERIRRKR